MEDVSVNVLVDAKAEYTNQLTSILAPLIYEGFNSLYDEAVDFKENTQDPRYDEYSELQIFQDYLRKIPKWNQDMIDQETKRIITKSKCEWLEDLLAAVFISNAKILSVIRIKNPSHQMKLKIPKLRNFIHKSYVECSREIYQNVYLFYTEDITTIEKQKNVRDIMKIIKEGIIESVRKLMPVQEIIKTYLGRIYDDDETENTIQSVHSGFEENLFRDFAKTKLRKSVDEILSGDESDRKSPRKVKKEETEESEESEEEQEESRVEEVKQENFTTQEKSSNNLSEQQTQEVAPEVTPQVIPSIDDIIKIREMPETPVENIQITSTFGEVNNEEQILKTILDKSQLVKNEETVESLTHENVKKIVSRDEEREKELRRKEREERHRRREEKRRRKEERRKRKILRNRDVRSRDQSDEETKERHRSKDSRDDRESREEKDSRDDRESREDEKYTETVETRDESEESVETRDRNESESESETETEQQGTFSFGGPQYNEEEL